MERNSEANSASCSLLFFGVLRLQPCVADACHVTDACKCARANPLPPHKEIGSHTQAYRANYEHIKTLTARLRLDASNASDVVVIHRPRRDGRSFNEQSLSLLKWSLEERFGSVYVMDGHEDLR